MGYDTQNIHGWVRLIPESRRESRCRCGSAVAWFDRAYTVRNDRPIPVELPAKMLAGRVATHQIHRCGTRDMNAFGNATFKIRGAAVHSWDNKF